MSSVEELIHRIGVSSLEEVSSASSSVEIIASSDGLLSEILHRLPVKILLKFKSVSKHWRSLITDPHFTRHHKIHKPASALFFQSQYSSVLAFVPLDPWHTTTTDLSSFVHNFDGSVTEIRNSCNGLFICRTSYYDDPLTYYVCNPTTKKFRTLPPTLGDGMGGAMALALDPSEPHLYKVICVRLVPESNARQIQIYSSETGSWRFCGAPFEPPTPDMDFNSGFYLNGAIHWVSFGLTSVYFNVKEEVIREVPMPPRLDEFSQREYRYFGESLGRLHVVEDYPFSDTDFGFNVYEMERDRSGWFVGFRVRLNDADVALPMPEDKFEILCVVRGVKDEDSFMVLHVPGKIIAYHFSTKSKRNICDLDDEIHDGWYPWYYAFQFIECLSPV